MVCIRFQWKVYISGLLMFHTKIKARQMGIQREGQSSFINMYLSSSFMPPPKILTRSNIPFILLDVLYVTSCNKVTLTHSNEFPCRTFRHSLSHGSPIDWGSRLHISLSLQDVTVHMRMWHHPPPLPVSSGQPLLTNTRRGQEVTWEMWGPGIWGGCSSPTGSFVVLTEMKSINKLRLNAYQVLL